MRSWMYGALAVAALAITPTAAAAQIQLGAELEAAFAGNDDLPEHEGAGIGYAGRIGFEIPLPVLKIIPEVRVSYTDFGEPDTRATERIPLPADVSVLRVTGGARVGFGEVIRPTVFAHVGYGNLALDVAREFIVDDTPDLDEAAFTWDAGVAFDVVALPFLDVGIHGAYNSLEIDDGFDWWTAGVHAVLAF